jgi:leucyl aminopeptidase
MSLPCFAASGPPLPLHVVRPEGWSHLPGSALAAATGFAAKPGEVALLADGNGLLGAMVGEADGPLPYGALPFALPEGTLWQADGEDLALGWALGAYRYAGFKPPKRAAARLLRTAPPLPEAEAIWRARDLINAPANILGPAELAKAVRAAASRHGARCRVVEGEELAREFPAVAAVGQGSPRGPRVAILEWGGDDPALPLVALCGKGVCFDTGGLDLKPSAAMLRMKKDMGGAAVALGVAEALMATGAKCRLLLLVGAVENSVSGASFRPLDVIRTRKGLSVEIGNTDAEGRLVLADLLAFAGEREPAFLLNFATLTGAARVALGPDLPALFSNDDALAGALLGAGSRVREPLWRLPLHEGYRAWLDSPVADLNNVAQKPFAGAIVAALFLERFAPEGVPWAHLDLYAWNDNASPGRPEGGEATGLRAVVAGLRDVVPR